LSGVKGEQVRRTAHPAAHEARELGRLGLCRPEGALLAVAGVQITLQIGLLGRGS
jgi:hypothetical protein